MWSEMVKKYGGQAENGGSSLGIVTTSAKNGQKDGGCPEVVTTSRKNGQKDGDCPEVVTVSGEFLTKTGMKTAKNVIFFLSAGLTRPENGNVDQTRAEGVCPGIKKLRRAEELAPKDWEE